MSNTKKLLLSAVCLFALPTSVLACACGCGVFDVSTATMMPTGSGGTAWLEYDYVTQNQNRNGLHSASRDDNEDKMIHTDFITAGVQYMFNRSWGFQAQLPYVNRNFKAQTEDGDAPTFTTHSFGDIRLKAVYSGLSEDMSTGLTFGLKLPSGAFNTEHFDRDTQIGTGSTDLLLGAYHMGTLSSEKKLGWFVNGMWQQAVSIQGNYRPGDELNVATGIYYEGLDEMAGGRLTPFLQLIGSARMRDRGANAHPEDTGYSRLLISPGLEYDIDKIKLYADVELPVYENVSGNQLTAPVQFKVQIGYSF
jgi:hypothetical protein